MGFFASIIQDSRRSVSALPTVGSLQSPAEGQTLAPDPILDSVAERLTETRQVGSLPAEQARPVPVADTSSVSVIATESLPGHEFSHQSDRVSAESAAGKPSHSSLFAAANNPMEGPRALPPQIEAIHTAATIGDLQKQPTARASQTAESVRPGTSRHTLPDGRMSERKQARPVAAQTAPVNAAKSPWEILDAEPLSQPSDKPASEINPGHSAVSRDARADKLLPIEARHNAHPGQQDSRTSGNNVSAQPAVYHPLSQPDNSVRPLNWTAAKQSEKARLLNPQVRIGQVNVIVESGRKSAAESSTRPAADSSSRAFLRSL